MKNGLRAGRGYGVAWCALAAALLLSCPVAALYTWWLSRRALKPLNHVGRTDIRRIR